MMSSDEDGPQNREKFTAERSATVEQSNVTDAGEDPEIFGPALPPHLLKKNKEEGEERERVYGPIMPSYLSKTTKDEEEEKLEAVNSESRTKESSVIGPEIPDHLKNRQTETEDENPDDSSDDDNDFGPSPNLMASGCTSSYYSSIGHKSKKEDSEKSITKRESWMIDLPEKKAAQFGLGPRQFRTRIPTEKESDRSVWTETPGNKDKQESEAKEKVHEKELKRKRLEERDKVMEKLAKKAAKKLRKQESLLEMHVKNMKKKKKKEAKELEKKGKQVPERRPFDRDKDLQIHRIDESQKRAILNKSKFLNDRFAAGESRFL